MRVGGLFFLLFSNILISFFFQIIEKRGSVEERSVFGRMRKSMLFVFGQKTKGKKFNVYF